MIQEKEYGSIIYFKEISMPPNEVHRIIDKFTEAGNELALERLTERSNAAVQKEMDAIEHLGRDDLTITGSLDALMQYTTDGGEVVYEGLDDDFALIFFTNNDGIDGIDDNRFFGVAIRKVQDEETIQTSYEVKLVRLDKDGDKITVIDEEKPEYYTPVFVEASLDDIDDESVFTTAIAGIKVKFNSESDEDTNISELLLRNPGYWDEGVDAGIPNLEDELDEAERVIELRKRETESEVSIAWAEKARSTVRGTDIVDTFEGIWAAIGHSISLPAGIGRDRADQQIRSVNRIAKLYDEAADRSESLLQDD
jgi:hypothetical protein